MNHVPYEQLAGIDMQFSRTETSSDCSRFHNTENYKLRKIDPLVNCSSLPTFLRPSPPNRKHCNWAGVFVVYNMTRSSTSGYKTANTLEIM